MTSALLAAALALSGRVTPWIQDCTDGCRPPRAAGPGADVALSVDVPMNPGEARVARFARDLDYGSGERVRVETTVYYLCPRRGAAGGDPCPSRYLQVQVALSGDASAYCTAALNPADAAPFPVMTCAGDDRRGPGRRLGVTLSREAPADAPAR